MAKGFDLVAEPREDIGKGASRRLRRSGKVPAIIYGGGEPPQNLLFDNNVLRRHMETEAFFSSVLKVKINGAEQQAILKDMQAHPAKRQVLHLDLQRIVATEKIRINVPIHLLNAVNAVGVRLGGGSVSHMLTEVEVSCLPADLPEFFELDIADLELDGTLFLSDIKLPDGVELPDLTQGDENNRPVVSIHIIKEIVEEEPEEDLEEGLEEGEEAPTEGEEAPAEGGEAEEPSRD